MSGEYPFRGFLLNSEVSCSERSPWAQRPALLIWEEGSGLVRTWKGPALSLQTTRSHCMVHVAIPGTGNQMLVWQFTVPSKKAQTTRL